MAGFVLVEPVVLEEAGRVEGLGEAMCASTLGTTSEVVVAGEDVTVVIGVRGEVVREGMRERVGDGLPVCILTVAVPER